MDISSKRNSYSSRSFSELLRDQKRNVGTRGPSVFPSDRFRLQESPLNSTRAKRCLGYESHCFFNWYEYGRARRAARDHTEWFFIVPSWNSLALTLFAVRGLFFFIFYRFVEVLYFLESKKMFDLWFSGLFNAQTATINSIISSLLLLIKYS